MKRTDDHWLIKPEKARPLLGLSNAMMQKSQPFLLVVLTPHRSHLYDRLHLEVLLRFLNGRTASLSLLRAFADSPDSLNVCNRERERFALMVVQHAKKGRLTTKAICQILDVGNNVVSDWVRSGSLTPKREAGPGNPQSYSLEEFMRVCRMIGPGGD